MGDQAVPKVTAKTTPAWQSTESTQVSPSTPSLTQIALSPKLVSVVINFSRQFSKQSNASAFIGNELLKTIGTAIDQAVINGSGAAGQPTGILSTAGLQSQSGTTLNAGCATMKRKSAEANVSDEGISFLSTPAIRELIEGREKAAGGGNSWPVTLRYVIHRHLLQPPASPRRGTDETTEKFMQQLIEPGHDPNLKSVSEQTDNSHAEALTRRSTIVHTDSMQGDREILRARTIGRSRLDGCAGETHC